jgi:hypothetical protein
MEVIMGIKDLIRQGNVKEVAEYLEQNRLSPQELSELRSFAEGAGRSEMLSFLDSVLAPNGRKDSDSSGNSSSVSSNIPGVNYDIEKAYKYLEELEQDYQKTAGIDIYKDENLCHSIDILMEKITDSRKFSQGFKDAILTYHRDMVAADYKHFILIELVQEFYERFKPDQYYDEELRNRHFSDLVTCVRDEIGQEEFLRLLGDASYHDNE